MNVKIMETGEVKYLAIYDDNKINWVSDLIGNAGALNDGQFTWCEDDNAYLANQDTYDWWDRYITDVEQTDKEVVELAEELGIDVNIISLAIQDATGYDYEDHRNEAIAAMENLREEYNSLGDNRMVENKFDSFVLYRFAKDDEWRLFCGKPLTEHGCNTLIKGLEQNNPQMEYKVVKLQDL